MPQYLPFTHIKQAGKRPDFLAQPAMRHTFQRRIMHSFFESRAFPCQPVRIAELHSLASSLLNPPIKMIYISYTEMEDTACDAESSHPFFYYEIRKNPVLIELS